MQNDGDDDRDAQAAGLPAFLRDNDEIDSFLQSVGYKVRRGIFLPSFAVRCDSVRSE